jgi:hypothetical protein
VSEKRTELKPGVRSADPGWAEDASARADRSRGRSRCQGQLRPAERAGPAGHSRADGDSSPAQSGVMGGSWPAGSRPEPPRTTTIPRGRRRRRVAGIRGRAWGRLTGRRGPVGPAHREFSSGGARPAGPQGRSLWRESECRHVPERTAAWGATLRVAAPLARRARQRLAPTQVGWFSPVQHSLVTVGRCSPVR